MASLFDNNNNNKTRLFFVLFTLCYSLFLVASRAKLQQLKHSVKADRSLSFLVLGDWGRQGNYNQSKVALQMGKVGKELDIDFVISTGDNFYEDGLTGVNDPAFNLSFSNIYTAPSLHKQWYSVLGNHDYRGNVLAQLSHVLTKFDNRWLCLRSFVLNTKIVDFFFVDTNPFVDQYFINPKGHKYDWRGVLPRKKYLSNLLKVRSQIGTDRNILCSPSGSGKPSYSSSKGTVNID